MKIRWPWRKSDEQREAGQMHSFSTELHDLRMKLDILGPTIKFVHGKSKAAGLVDRAAALLSRAALEAQKEEEIRKAQGPKKLTDAEIAKLAFFEILNPIAAQSRDPNDESAMRARQWVKSLTSQSS